MLRKPWIGVAALVLMLAAAWLAAGQEATDASQVDADPPARAARLSLIEGSVSLRPNGVEDWNAAPLNQPLTDGDSLWTETGSHAEIDLGAAVARLDGRTSLTVLDMGDQAQLRLDAGTIDLALNGGDAASAVEIDAPNAAVLLQGPGEYRIGVDNAGNTSVAVRAGQAQVQGNDRQVMNLATGQRALFGSNGSYALAQIPAPDDFDFWCQQRQARWTDEQAVTQYVSSDVVGYQDLQDSGQWQQVPDYGYVWYPTQVSEDWAPYSSGHWAWVGPWGWSWVDDAPWGFAPFHYGRWAHIGRRWCWVPPPRRHHCVYAPALVAWVGGPGSAGAIALGGGAAVGWLPLAPGEVYLPAHRASPRYLQNINVSNSTGLSAGTVSAIAHDPSHQYRYANQAIPRAVTVVPQVNFAAGQSVSRHQMVPPTQFASATPVARAPAIVPERESVVGSVPLGRVGRPPASISERPVVTRRPPPPALPSFETQQRAIQANGGLPLDGAQLRSLRGASASPPAAPVAIPEAHHGNPGRPPAPQVRPPAVQTPQVVQTPRVVQTPQVVQTPPARTPLLQVPRAQQPQQPPPQALGPNVFRQRDQELQQQRETELRQQAQERQQRLAEQQRLQQAQQVDQQQRLEQQRLEQQQRSQLQEQQRLQFEEQARRQQQIQSLSPAPSPVQSPPHLAPPPPPNTQVRSRPEGKLPPVEQR